MHILLPFYACSCCQMRVNIWFILTLNSSPPTLFVIVFRILIAFFVSFVRFSLVNFIPPYKFLSPNSPSTSRTPAGCSGARFVARANLRLLVTSRFLWYNNMYSVDGKEARTPPLHSTISNLPEMCPNIQPFLFFVRVKMLLRVNVKTTLANEVSLNGRAWKAFYTKK